MSIEVITNNQPRDIVEGWELSAEEQAEFDYINWKNVERGDETMPSFVRFKGELYDLGEFSADYGITRGAGLPAHLSDWDGYFGETAFSAVVIRWVEDGERVVVGRVVS